MSSPSEPASSQETAQCRQGSSQHDQKTLYKLSLIITILLLTLALSMYSEKDIYIFGYIMVLVYALHEVAHHHRSWQELGLKHGL